MRGTKVYHRLSAVIFGASMILLYTANGVFHGIPFTMRTTRLFSGSSSGSTARHIRIDRRDEHTVDSHALEPRLAAVVPLGNMDPGSSRGRLYLDSFQAPTRGNYRHLYRVGIAWVSSRCSLLPDRWVASDELGVGGMCALRSWRCVRVGRVASPE